MLKMLLPVLQKQKKINNKPSNYIDDSDIKLSNSEIHAHQKLHGAKHAISNTNDPIKKAMLYNYAVTEYNKYKSNSDFDQNKFDEYVRKYGFFD